MKRKILCSFILLSLFMLVGCGKDTPESKPARPAQSIRKDVDLLIIQDGFWNEVSFEG